MDDADPDAEADVAPVLSLPDATTVAEVLPRDGLQRLDRFVPTERKVELVEALAATGVAEVEVTSFTRPEAVPALRDAEAVFEALDRRPDVTYRALVPNRVGAERAIAAGADKVNALVTVSEAYCERNQNMSVDENLDELAAVVDVCHDAGVSVEAGLATSFFCPYTGRVSRDRTLDVAGRALAAGVDEVTLATTMGMADPVTVDRTLAAARSRYDADWGLHLHDTNGMSLANTLVALSHGVTRLDASVCGLGGGVVLPESLREVGNTPTEDLCLFCREMGVETGVDFDALVAVARETRDALSLDTRSHVLAGGRPETVLDATGGA